MVLHDVMGHAPFINHIAITVLIKAEAQLKGLHLLSVSLLFHSKLNTLKEDIAFCSMVNSTLQKKTSLSEPDFA